MINRNNPPLLFCQLIEETLQTCQLLSKKSRFSVFNDGLDDIRKQLNVLKRVYEKELKPQVKSQKFKIPISVFREIVIEEKLVDEAKKMPARLKLQAEQTKAKLRDKERKITEEFLLQRSDKMLDIGKKIEKENLEYDKTKAEIEELTRKRDVIIEKKRQKCCSFFSCCVSQENEDIDKINQEIFMLNAKFQELKVSQSDKNSDAKSISVELEKIDEQLEQVDRKYLQQEKMAEEKLEAAEKKLDDLELTEEKEAERFLSKVNAQSMADFVRVYALYNNLRKKAEFLPNSTINVKNLKMAINRQKIALDKLLDIIWTMDSVPFKLRECYSNYLQFNNEEKRTFLTGKTSFELSKKLFWLEITKKSSIFEIKTPTF